MVGSYYLVCGRGGTHFLCDVLLGEVHLFLNFRKGDTYIRILQNRRLPHPSTNNEWFLLVFKADIYGKQTDGWRLCLEPVVVLNKHLPYHIQL